MSGLREDQHGREAGIDCECLISFLIFSFSFSNFAFELFASRTTSCTFADRQPRPSIEGAMPFPSPHHSDVPGYQDQRTAVGHARKQQEYTYVGPPRVASLQRFPLSGEFLPVGWVRLEQKMNPKDGRPWGGVLVIKQADRKSLVDPRPEILPVQDPYAA